MKWIGFGLGLLLAIGASGCDDLVLSLQPLATEETTITDAKLAGKWACDDQIWEFVPTDNKEYHLRIAEMFSSCTFKVRLVEVLGQRFLDMMPDDLSKGTPMGMVFAMHLLSTHSLWRVHMEDSALSLEIINRETLTKMIDQDPNLLEHQDAEGRLVLSGPTEQLQSFLAHDSDANDLWKEGVDLERCRPLYSKDQVITEPNLIGRWSDPNMVLDVTQPEGRLYRLNGWEKDSPVLTAWAYLVQRDDVRFWAAFYDKPPFNPKDPQSDLIPDIVILIEQFPSQLRLKPLELTKIGSQLEEDPNALLPLGDTDTMSLTRHDLP
jgi:hypothetical protein